MTHRVDVQYPDGDPNEANSPKPLLLHVGEGSIFTLLAFRSFHPDRDRGTGPATEPLGTINIIVSSWK